MLREAANRKIVRKRGRRAVLRLPQGKRDLLVRIPFALHGTLLLQGSGCPKKPHSTRARFKGQDHISGTTVGLGERAPSSASALTHDTIVPLRARSPQAPAAGNSSARLNARRQASHAAKWRADLNWLAAVSDCGADCCRRQGTDTWSRGQSLACLAGPVPGQYPGLDLLNPIPKTIQVVKQNADSLTRLVRQ